MAESRRIRYDPSSDYYRILNVPASASIDDIHRAFRQLAKEVHPDAVPPSKKEWAHRQFQKINEAHDILSDPSLRAEYDRQRTFHLSAAFNKATVPPTRLNRPNVTRINWLITAVIVTVVILISGTYWRSHLAGPDPRTDFPAWL